MKRRSLEYIATFDFRPSTEFTPGLLASLEIRPTLLDQIGMRQQEDPELTDILRRMSDREISRHLQHYSMTIEGGS